jgi:hypothetical protein
MASEERLLLRCGWSRSGRFMRWRLLPTGRPRPRHGGSTGCEFEEEVALGGDRG